MYKKAKNCPLQKGRTSYKTKGFAAFSPQKQVNSRVKKGCQLSLQMGKSTLYLCREIRHKPAFETGRTQEMTRAGRNVFVWLSFERGGPVRRPRGPAGFLKSSLTLGVRIFSMPESLQSVPGWKPK